MKKYTLILIALLQLSLFGCATTQTQQPVSKVPPAGETAITPVLESLGSGSGVVTENLTFKCMNCDERESKIVAAMQKKLNETIQTQCFADHIVLEKYRSQLVQTDGLTRQQVVQKIQNTVIKDIPLQFYYNRFSGVYGYTYPNDPTIYLNRWYRTVSDYSNGSWSVCAETSNSGHEATHKMGFDHDFKDTPRRPYSVPYTTNFAIDACCKQ